MFTPSLTRTSPFYQCACLYTYLILAAGTGCRQEEDPAHSHGTDDHEDKTAQVTVWSDRFEVFLEHKPIAAGAATTFVTHVTDLKTHEPRRSGAVRFVLISGADSPVEHVDPGPARPGIYTPKLIFPRAGRWTVALHIPTDGGEVVVELGEFIVYVSHEETHDAQIAEAPEGIPFLKEQQWKLGTRTDRVDKRHLVERLRVPGRVNVRPGSRARVTAPLAGRLLPPPAGELPALGTRVEADQTLALLQPPLSELLGKLIDSEAEVMRTQLGVELAELTHSRVEKLASQQLKTAREKEEADFALRTAHANHEAARAIQAAYHKAGALFVSTDPRAAGAARLPTLELKAPIAGLVTELAAAVGEHVPIERAILTILDPERVHIEARVPESDLDRIGSPGGALYELPQSPGELHPLLMDGASRAVYIAPEVDPATRTVSLTYAVMNPSGQLRIGQTLTVYLEAAEAVDALAVPESAVVDEEGRPVAFVQVSGETFEKRYLTLGLRDGGFVQVNAGLSEGERVATRGAYSIRLASISTSIPAHGHAH